MQEILQSLNDFVKLGVFLLIKTRKSSDKLMHILIN